MVLLRNFAAKGKYPYRVWAAESRDVVKVQNSWGKDWQNKNDDGWVDAKTLFSYVTADPARMENVLSWYH